MRQMAGEDAGLVAKQCRRHDLGKDVQNVEEVRVGDEGQVNAFLDLPTSHQSSDSIVFPQSFISGSRPSDQSVPLPRR